VEGILLAFPNRYYLFQDPIVIGQVPHVIRPKGTSNAKTHIFFGLSVTTLLSVLLLLILFSIYCNMLFSVFAGKTILI
jgi:hypothetical protein